MLIFYALIAFVLVFLCISLVVLFGDLPNNRGTTLHKLNILLVDKSFNFLSSQFQYLDNRFINGTLTSEKSKNRLIWISGWIIPMFYLTIMSRCLLYFFQYTYPQIIEFETKLDIHVNSVTRYWLVIIPTILVNYVSFLLAVLSDPGYIDPVKNTPQLKSPLFEAEFPFDNLLFFNGKECSTCKITKPARSKHCATCDKCVLMFDHHCIWLNNDVAYYTFRWFFLFLFSICFIFIYGGYLCYYSLNLYLCYSENIPDGIKTATVLKKYWNLIKWTTFDNQITGIMLIFCICLFPLIGYFFCETLKSVYLGVTTNEIAKWDTIHDLIEEKRLFEFVLNNESEKIYLICSDSKSNIKFYQLKNYMVYNSNIGGILERVKSWDDLDNVYDKGFWNNLYQKLFPKKL